MNVKNTQPAANRTIQKNARGSSALEFSLVAPVLFYLVLITFDLGLHIVAMIAVENAARAAAARAAAGLRRMNQPLLAVPGRRETSPRAVP